MSESIGWPPILQENCRVLWNWIGVINSLTAPVLYSQWLEFPHQSRGRSAKNHSSGSIGFSHYTYSAKVLSSVHWILCGHHRYSNNPPKSMDWVSSQVLCICSDSIRMFPGFCFWNRGGDRNAQWYCVQIARSYSEWIDMYNLKSFLCLSSRRDLLSLVYLLTTSDQRQPDVLYKACAYPTLPLWGEAGATRSWPRWICGRTMLPLWSGKRTVPWSRLGCVETVT